MSVNSHRLVIPGITQIAKLVRKREVVKKKTSTTETTYLITNFSFEEADAAKILKIKTDYWAIENKVHYIADFVFGEDRSTIRAKNGPRVMSALSAFAMNVMRACGIGNLKRCVANLQNAPQNFFAKAA
jgi:predicted transposase YbfD/YdcC